MSPAHNHIRTDSVIRGLVPVSVRGTDVSHLSDMAVHTRIRAGRTWGLGGMGRAMLTTLIDMRLGAVNAR